MKQIWVFYESWGNWNFLCLHERERWFGFLCRDLKFHFTSFDFQSFFLWFLSNLALLSWFSFFFFCIYKRKRLWCIDLNFHRTIDQQRRIEFNMLWLLGRYEGLTQTMIPSSYLSRWFSKFLILGRSSRLGLIFLCYIYIYILTANYCLESENDRYMQSCLLLHIYIQNFRLLSY